MKYEFSAYGHPNITARHRTTIELTKDSELTKKGDCIIGVNAGFKIDELKRFLGFRTIKIRILAGGASEEITASPNPDFSSDNELVIRKGEFRSERTFATNSDKASSDIKRALIEALRKGGLATISIEEITRFK